MFSLHAAQYRNSGSRIGFNMLKRRNWPCQWTDKTARVASINPHKIRDWDHCGQNIAEFHGRGIGEAHKICRHDSGRGSVIETRRYSWLAATRSTIFKSQSLPRILSPPRRGKNLSEGRAHPPVPRCSSSMHPRFTQGTRLSKCPKKSERGKTPL